jgi:mannose-6-phosphate isomerase-like protein (cupin superfamily)
VPAEGAKTIDEFIGRASSRTEWVSVAVMRAPPDWEEPAQTPEFDEVTLVLSGTVVVHHDSGDLSVPTGQAVLTRRGERVRYASPEGAEYISICLPAFSPETVHRES